jgi:hypothetical protein
MHSIPSPVRDTKKISSAMKGSTRAPTKGHPSTVPMPNHINPWAVLIPPLQSMNAWRPSIVAYIAKLEGK